MGIASPGATAIGRLSPPAIPSAGIALNHENPTIGPKRNDPVGLFQVLSRIPLGAAGATTQRFTFYPDFKESDAYRSEMELAAQAAMNTHFALKLGYLVRRSNAPVFGFKKTDTMATASVATSPTSQSISQPRLASSSAHTRV